MNVECRGDKIEFMKRIQELGKDTLERVALRLPFEQSIENIWR